ncbi:MAG: tetratricopeptide repeat protein [Gammaproteobacteria bacterium]
MFKTTHLLPAACLLAASLSIAAAETDSYAAVKQLAEQGNALAQAKLGAMYHLGRGTGQNEEQAVHWMLKAAEQNYVDAEVFIAAMYERGMGVPQSIETATQWYQKAAAQGQETAQGLLGPYKLMRTKASAQIPNEYAKKILRQK